MKKIKYFPIFTIIFTIFLFNSANKIPTKVNGASISRAECVIEINSGRVLYSLNEEEKLPIASTTKVLTAITVIENANLDEIIKVNKNTTGIEGSSVYLREGERLTIKELLFGLMLRSGNDCAETLATAFTTREDFIIKMNTLAKKVGAVNSNFINPHGLHDVNHYSTAKDMALITSYAMKNSVFKEIVSTKKVTISNDGYDYKRVLINKNKMLNSYKGCTGVKTGYTKNAGRCLVSSANKNGLEIVTVVLNSPDMWNRSMELLDSGFNNYKNESVVNKQEIENTVYTDEKGNKFLLKVESGFNYVIKNNEVVNIKINGKTFEEFIKNPENFGKLEVFIENNLIFSTKIYTIKCK